jgi:hypothetical protein
MMDAASLNDGKLIRLRAKHGWAGEGVYWYVIRVMRLNSGRLHRDAVAGLAYSMRYEDLDGWIADAVHIGLFRWDAEDLVSDRLLSDIQEYEDRLSGLRSGAEKTNAWRAARRSAKRAPSVNLSIHQSPKSVDVDSGVGGSGEKGDERVAHGSHVRLAPGEFDRLKESLKGGEATLRRLIDSMNDYLAAGRKKPYRDFAAALRNWARKDGALIEAAAKVDYSGDV